MIKKVDTLCDKVEQLEAELERFRNYQISKESHRLIKKVRSIGKIKLIIDFVHHDVNLKMLRMIVSILKDKLVSGGVVVCINPGSLAYIVVGVTQDIIRYVNAVEIITYLTNTFGGSGGGRLDLAQSGGSSINLLPSVIDRLNILLIKKFESYNV